MKRAGRWILWSLSGFLLLPLLALALLMLAAGNPDGRAEIERAVSVLSAERVVVSGLGGGLPGRLSVKRIELHDAGGSWLTIDELLLDWLPIKLLAGEVAIERLQARQLAVARSPMPSAVAEPEPSGGLSLPLDVNLNSLLVERFEMAAPLAGQAISLGIDGRLGLNTAYRGEIELNVRQFAGEGAYRLQGRLSEDMLQARLSLHEAPRGPLAALAGLRNRGALALEASLEGPLSAVVSRMTLKFDELQTWLDGSIDFAQPGADLDIAVTAPAMQLRPDLAWRALALNLKLRGPLTGLDANGGLHLDGLNAAQTAIGSLDIKLRGTNGNIELDGELAGLRLPDSQTDVLQATPLAFQVQMGLDKPDRPIALVLKHPLIDASGQASMAESKLSAELALNLPNLQPFAALHGMPLDGHGKLTLKFVRQDQDSRLDMAGILGLGGSSALAKLLGESAKFDLSMTREGKDITLSRLQLDGKALSASAHGELASGHADFDWQAQLNDVSAIAANASGQLAAQGSLMGELDNFSLKAELDGDLAGKGYPAAPINANLELQHLPNAADGRMNLSGKLSGSPIEVRLAVHSPGDKATRLAIDKAEWKSAQASGGLTLTRDGSPPSGKIAMKISRLADFRPMIGQPLVGSADATLEMGARAGRPQAKLRLEARNTGLEKTAMLDSARLALTVDDPAAQANLDGLLILKGINAGQVNGSAQLKLEGPLKSVRLRLSAASPNLNGSDAQLSAAAQLNAAGGELAMSAMQANWRRQTVRLLAPAKIMFADGLSVDRLRLGLQRAELEMAGRFTPELALTAELHKTPADLISLFAPDLAMTGTLHADAKLHGRLAQPAGLVRFEADNLQMKQGSGRGLPPVQIRIAATLHGDAADLDAKLNAGNDGHLQIAGQVPMAQAGLFDLQGDAALDLKLLNPLLSAEGRRMRGRLVADVKLAGSRPSPAVTASARIAGGEWQDYAAGVGIVDIAALLKFEDGLLRLVNLQGRAGNAYRRRQRRAVGGDAHRFGGYRPQCQTLGQRAVDGQSRCGCHAAGSCRRIADRRRPYPHQSRRYSHSGTDTGRHRGVETE